MKKLLTLSAKSLGAVVLLLSSSTIFALVVDVDPGPKPRERVVIGETVEPVPVAEPETIVVGDE